ncbi:MAG: BACON domain-containing protein [Mediterranea sp.]|jgi:hypothetical protein|nr:BACON domain-containing protein [Mediterranea sp.]
MAGSKLKWGKMTVEIAPVTAGVIGVYAPVYTPVQGSFTLTVEEGNKLEAFIEGGERIDVRKDANKYSFEFQVHIGEGLTKPIADVDGIIAGEYAIRVTPENSTLEGFLMERAAVSVTESFTSEEGHRASYTFEALKPATGAMLKPYVAQILVVTPTQLAFSSAADNAGQTITATSTGNLTYAGKSDDAEWLTVTRSGKVATVKVVANTNSESRIAYVTLTADGKSATVPVTQAGA